MYILSYILFFIEIGLQSFFSIVFINVCIVFNAKGWIYCALILLNALVLCILRFVLRKKRKFLGIASIVDLLIVLASASIMGILGLLAPIDILPFTGIFGIASSIILFFVPEMKDEEKELSTLEDYIGFVDTLKKLRLFNQVNIYHYKYKMHYVYTKVQEYKIKLVEDINHYREALKENEIGGKEFIEKTEGNINEILKADQVLDSIARELSFKGLIIEKEMDNR